MTSNHKPFGIGIIGCGDISGIYIHNLQKHPDEVSIVSIAARTFSHAQEAAKKHNIPKAQTVEELLSNPDVDIVLNLTIPAAHYSINKQALEAGKHVYSEKPLAIELNEAKELLTIAEKKNLRVGCAPDTVLGGGIQTCRKLIDSGAIGRPLAANINYLWFGPEREHPNPAFLYQYGAGPVFDMGPYYLTMLVSLLGPAESVCAFSSKGFPERTCTCPGPHTGETFPVEIPTHNAGTIRFANGTIATVIFSFDVWNDPISSSALFGTKGSIKLPDPDTFGGLVSLMKEGGEHFEDQEISFPHTENSRGLGLLDMAAAIRENRPHRANGKIAAHVLEIMHALSESAETHQFIGLETTCEIPETMPSDN